MKRKEGFVEEKVGEFYYLFPNGENIDGKIFSMNDTCKYIWDLLENEHSEQQIISAVAAYYGVKNEIVSEDIQDILSQMSMAKLIEK